MPKTDVVFSKGFCGVVVTAEDLQREPDAISHYLSEGWEITYDGRAEEDDDGA